jgi:1-acyl-sn-glycerol-3-phosphate acyltransferase
VVYWLLKIYARFCIKIYSPEIKINKPEVLNSKGPLLIASNHPNSFLDGMILTTLFRHPVHSLARGDVFKNPLVNKILRSLQLLPVYRTSEGVENLEHNYTTFAACRETFKEKGIVLIFSEGQCVNEWHLRPLKKGTARLAITAWQENIPLTVIPLGINYSSFRQFGKKIHLNFGEAFTRASINQSVSSGKQLLDFNSIVQEQLEKLVYEIDEKDKKKAHQLFSIKKDPAFYFLLLPGLAGWILHLPFFLLVTIATRLGFRYSGHYDSVQTALLVFGYFIYWPLLALFALSFGWLYGLVAFFFLPLFARAAVQLKYKLDL